MLQQQKELKSFSTLGIGGPARYFIEALSLADLKEGLLFAKKESLELLVIGKGSNSLFDDRGFNGLVIYNNISHVEFGRDSVFASGGYSFARLGLASARREFAGLEFAAGIPGSVGGAVFMNAGAGGSDVAAVLSECVWLDRDGEMHTFRRDALEFSYRHSSFQTMEGIICSARFALEKDPGAKKRCQELLAKRLKSQPYGEKSAGCFFRNPHKGCAGEWIERLGLKGMRVGDAEVSMLHSNFIINKGDATSRDVRALIEHVQEKVKAAFGERLILEVRLIPYERKAHVPR